MWPPGPAPRPYDSKMASVSNESRLAGAPAQGGGGAILGVLSNQRQAWFAVIFFSIVINFMMLTPAFYMMQVSNRVYTSRNLTTLVMLTLLALGLYLAMSALEWARTRILVRIGVALDHALGARLLRVSHQMTKEQGPGEGRRLLTDLEMVRVFITGPGALAALDAPWIPIFFVVTFFLHPGICIAMIAGSIVLFGLTWLTEATTNPPLQKANERAAEASRFATVNMRNGEVIEAMGMLRSMVNRWQKRRDEYLVEQALASDRAGLITSITKFVRVAHQSLISAYSAYLTIQGEITPGVMMASWLLSSRMTGPIEMLIATWTHWGSARDARSRIDEALKLPEPSFASIDLPAPQGEITLEGIYGAPPGFKSMFIQNVNLKIPAGASVAIVGPSASGKSSLIRLIAGVWLPRAGAVRIDGSDIQTWSREKLGPHVGYLPQDVELIEGSVAENIARHGELDSHLVLEAAEAAGVHDMILQLPDGYSTEVGANGCFLSGGQRQRIGLARALYGKPAVLILDEPNANLDEAGELALDKALRSATENRQTVLIVSHRPIAIRNCELVLVMTNGQVTVYGPRDQVMAVIAKAAGAKEQSVVVAGQKVRDAVA